MANEGKGSVVVSEVQPKQEIKTVYLQPGVAFNELPQVTVDFITDLCKDKYSKEIMALGTLTDSKLAGFRNQWLIDTASAAHRQLAKIQATRQENRARDLYTQLRARGIAVEEASKASGYNPLV